MVSLIYQVKHKRDEHYSSDFSHEPLALVHWILLMTLVTSHVTVGDRYHCHHWVTAVTITTPSLTTGAAAPLSAVTTVLPPTTVTTLPSCHQPYSSSTAVRPQFDQSDQFSAKLVGLKWNYQQHSTSTHQNQHISPLTTAQELTQFSTTSINTSMLTKRICTLSRLVQLFKHQSFSRCFGDERVRVDYSVRISGTK